MCHFYQKLIPLFNVSTNNKSSSVFIKLIKMVSYFLTICLYGKIGLSKCNNLFSRFTVLHNQISSISRKLIIFNRFTCSPSIHDFADLSKIVFYFMTAILTSNHRSVHYLLKISPLRIIKYSVKFSCTPILTSVFPDVFYIFKFFYILLLLNLEYSTLFQYIF